MPTVDEAVAKYVQLRDKKAQIKKAAEDQVKVIDAALDKIETFLLEKANEDGVESFKTEHGTAFKKVDNRIGIADRGAFNEFVLANKLPDFFQARVNTTSVMQYIEGGGELPPGLNLDRKYTISIRRSNAK